jgi:amino acid adenylation domain-containing protein
MPAEAGREFWRGVLVAGGSTVIPRWTSEPRPGIGEYSVVVPEAGQGALREPGVSRGAVLLAAHAAVLAALSGEQDVVTGYVTDGGPLPCRLTTEPGPWRGLVREAARAEGELLAHADVPVEALRRELGVAGPSFETEFDPTGADGDLAGGTVLRVTISDHDHGIALRLRYRTDVVDDEAAARIAGYHVAALALMAADPDAEHRHQNLLSAEELAFQLAGLAGPDRKLPDLRVHELFEQRVEEQPDAVAAVHGDRRWTYRELNARANRLGRALMARNLPREAVVTVVMERNLDWMASVLAIWKAGLTYLPLEPHFPPGRMATAISRAESALVLTERGSTTTLDQAVDTLPAVRRLFVDEVYAEGHADGNLGVAVDPDQLAYVLFTSGSTGEPKGAMCEHAGMLNHIQAKLADLGVGEGEVIPQTGPQCFDISVWQLVGALLVGGSTLFVEQEVILDVERFVDTIVEGRAGVVQVVPSYLEVVVSYLEQHPRELPDLHCVCPTGDFLKKEIVQRWFAIQPGIPLVNTYGLTETSDDAVHEIMHRTPDEDQVPLGRPIQNTTVYVVDEHLVPVPLGAPGLIVFSGVCVGRGYVNDPERTRLMFGADPHREGERICRTGDYGRWRPDGKLDFLGRRDNQVKIRGFRIEIGEVENGLLRVPGVRDGAAVVAEGADGTKRLVAFYSAPQPIEADVLRDRVAESVPEYMVPSAFHRRDSLPLTPNGKIDRSTLTALAGELDVVEEAYEAPSTPTEQRLAGAWGTVLGIPEDQIGRRDHFFDRGGTSLSAVKLAITLKRVVSLTDITRNPVLADLARMVDGKSERRSGLLQSLSESQDAEVGALVCFPFAGGNAVNYQPMAGALRGTGPAVLAVELPGHDLAADRRPFAPMAQVVDGVVAEIRARGLKRVMLWGHSAGTAFALETARKLVQCGVEVRRVFLSAYLLGDAAGRRAALADLSARTNGEVAAGLAASGGFSDLDAERAEHVGAAYRHDSTSAHRYFAEALDAPPAERLSVPVTVVVAADDPKTADSPRRYREWEALVEHVDLHELADGGHYFLRTRPAEAARAVLLGAELLAVSSR